MATRVFSGGTLHKGWSAVDAGATSCRQRNCGTMSKLVLLWGGKPVRSQGLEPRAPALFRDPHVPEVKHIERACVEGAKRVLRRAHDGLAIQVETRVENDRDAREPCE